MKDTIAERILTEHLVEGKLKQGEEVGLSIDQVLTQDATGTMVYLEFESLGIPAVKASTAVSYVDHNIIQTDSRNADDHRFLQSCAAKFGVVFCFYFIDCDVFLSLSRGASRAMAARAKPLQPE